MADCRQFGDIEVTAFSAGRCKLDGGTMFGVVPRAIWSREMAPDDENRIWLGLTCLLVKTLDETILIESGIGGGKLTKKYQEIFAADPSEGVAKSLGEMGTDPENVDRVILTHLHMDHAGGATYLAGNDFRPTFPNARYTVQRLEWEDALGADRQTVRGYHVNEDLLPLERAGVLDLVEGDMEVCPGVQVFLTPGHTRAHQSVLVHSGEEKVCFVGDLVPTSHHMHPVFIMAFDLYPRDTYRVRQEVLGRAESEHWLLAWPHDPDRLWGYVQAGKRGNYTVMEE